MKSNSGTQAVEDALQERFLPLNKLDDILSSDTQFDIHVDKLNTSLDDTLEIEIPNKRGAIANGHKNNGSTDNDPFQLKKAFKTKTAPAPSAPVGQLLQGAKMTREEERCLAKRMEFFKRRLIKAVDHANLDKQQRLAYLRDIPCKGHDRVKERPGACLLCEKIGACPKKKKGAVHKTCKAYNLCRSSFVERNLHIVKYIAQTYSTYGVPPMDLIQEGNAALIRAVEKFDWRKQVRLQTYAEFWIRQAMERLINASKWIVRVPTYMQQRMRRIRREGKLPSNGSRVTTREVSKAFKTSPTVARHLLETERGHLSLDCMVTNGEQIKPSDLIADKGAENFLPEEIEYRKKKMEEALALLTGQERTIISYRFELGGFERKTLSELGSMLDISRERVRQIEARTLEKLRKPRMLGTLKYYI